MKLNPEDKTRAMELSVETYQQLDRLRVLGNFADEDTKRAETNTIYLAICAALMASQNARPLDGDSPRWVADLENRELSERQPDGSYKVAYHMLPIDPPPTPAGERGQVGWMGGEHDR